MTKEKFIVQKIPSSENSTEIRQEFKSMPRMYLELFENKEKIKPEVVNKEFDIVNDMNGIDSSEFTFPSTVNEKEIKTQPNHNFSYDSDSEVENIPLPIHNPPNTPIHSPPNTPIHSPPNTPNHSPEVFSTESIKSPTNLSNKLMELLQDDSGDETTMNNRKSFENFQKSKREPPKLSELNSEYKPFETNRENEDEEKRKLLFRFDMLRNSYPNSNIPEFTIHSNINDMKQSYENSLRRVSIETNADTYKKYLIGSFMLIEYGLGHYLHFDMEGFSQHQIKNMNSYERLLIELGEKSYIPENQQYPVELRLLGLIVINTTIFVTSKVIMQKTGADLINVINNMNIANEPSVKRKMKGPKIDF